MRVHHGFLVIRDISGQRHAWRLHTLQGVTEDIATDRTVLLFAGNRIITIDESFDHVFGLITSQAAPSSAGSKWGKSETLA